MMRPLRRELMFQLVETSRLLRTYVDQRARQHGTTRAQWGLLSRLRRAEGLNQAALAEQMDLQPISLARLVDRLEQQKLVERREDAGDRRVRLLHLTPEGRELVEGLESVRGEIAGEVLAGVDDAAIEAALETLGTIRDRTRPQRDERAQAARAAGRAA